MKYNKLLFTLAGIALSLPVTASLMGWVVLFVGMIFSPNPPQPEIKYGEFPFKLVYEFSGEQKIIEDTLICEYDGIGWNESYGKYRKWKSYLKSGNQKIILLQIDSNNCVYYTTGSAPYFMGDNDEDKDYYPRPGFYSNLKSGHMSSKQLLEEYGIRLVNWDKANPIINEFR